MTRYEQLANVAIPCTHKHFDYYEACQRLAYSIAADYVDFLEYPHEKVVFVPLDQNLSRIEKTEPISFETTLVFGDDGFWYFCFRIKYEKNGEDGYMFEYIKLGLKINGQIVTVRGDSDAELDTTRANSFEEFFERLFHDSMERFKTLPFLPTKRIGFVRKPSDAYPYTTVNWSAASLASTLCATRTGGRLPDRGEGLWKRF